MADSSAVANAAKWISTSLIQEGNYLYGVQDHVRELEKDLKCIQLLLQDVDEDPHRLTSQDSQLGNFTREMRDLAFRAEDAIDTYVVDVGAKVYRKNLFLRIACLVSHSYPVHMLIKEREAIQQEIQKATNRFETFRNILKPSGNIGSVSSSQPSRTENYIHLDDEIVVGIDDDISHLVGHLTDPEDDFKVLAIVGTGGGGKTTLATQLYRHTQVENWFSHKAFVSFSQKWSRIDVLQRIFKEVKVGDVIPSDETKLVKELHEFLKDTQCLLVLDDMWKNEAWDDVYPVLHRSNKGCRVIITTRKEELPLHADNKCIIHKPKLLTEDQKWALFSKVTMEGRVGIEKNDAFEKLGRQMLKKCKGLPLAVVTLAGVLRTKQERYQWEAISKDVADFILEGKGTPNYGAVESMLELSYLDLPSYLKPCFLYLSIFLEDWNFKASNLTQMWIAEGFVTNDLQKGQETLEDAATRLLEELAQRCILQVTKRSIQGKIYEFRVHDLMREFCIKKAKEHQFFGSISSTFPGATGSRQPRRTAVLDSEHYPQENDHLRTLLDFGKGGKLASGARENLESTPNKFKLLRVLCIWYLDYVALPNQIGNLIHLRYLNIFNTQISVLPKSIRNLRNLLYLIYNNTETKDVVGVPDDLVGNMENLRVLLLPNSLKRGSLNRLGLNGPKNLQMLRSGAGTWMIKELPTLSHTVHTLAIYNIQEKEEMEALYQCPSIREDTLQTLWFSCILGTEEPLGFKLEKLRHCTTLWNLYLSCPLASSSEGTIIQFPPNLVRLDLLNSGIEERDDLMQVLGELPKLKHLSLGRGSYLGKQLSCTTRGFPQLKVLHLRDLENLEECRMKEWAMARLGKIWIDNCPNLKRLPESIRCIITLKELKITEMPKEFCKRIGYKGSTTKAEDSYIIQHIPSVIVRVST